MIEGFEDALDAFIERQEIYNNALAKLYGINGKRNEELENIEQQINSICQCISDRDNLHREELPPEAFQGYGGQTPQYVDTWRYGPTKKEKKKLDCLYQKLHKVQKKIEEEYAKISLYQRSLSGDSK